MTKPQDAEFVRGEAQRISLLGAIVIHRAKYLLDADLNDKSNLFSLSDLLDHHAKSLRERLVGQYVKFTDRYVWTGLFRAGDVAARRLSATLLAANISLDLRLGKRPNLVAYVNDPNFMDPIIGGPFDILEHRDRFIIDTTKRVQLDIPIGKGIKRMSAKSLAVIWK